MSKKFLYVIILLALVLGGWYWYAGQGGSAAAPKVELNADVYPLYSGIAWGGVEATSSPERGVVSIVRSVPVTDTTDIAAVSMPFEKYYEDKLTAAGWVRDMMEEASGPGANISVYRKADQFVVVSFSSVFQVRQPDMPVQCPCDVQLTLLSGMQTGPTRAEILAARTYLDAALGFSVILPTAISPSKSDSLWSVDTAYEYQANGPGKAITGVKFTIPTSLAAGTNLSGDSYVSVEHLPAGAKCDAAVFMPDPNVKSETVKEGVLSYSVASSTGAAAGNRYDETVYARIDSSPCITVRYFIHYAAIQNFPEGTVREFDEAALLQEFDQIRRTLTLGKI